MRPRRWADRRRGALSTPMVSGTAFGGLAPEASPEEPATPAPVVVDGHPVAAYLKGRDDSWCAKRRGVWWPTLGLWVDRLELTTEDVPPPGARTYPLVPPAGFDVGAVHGQVDEHGVAHVLVTGPGGEVITQASVAGATDVDRPHLVIATLVAAVGLAEEPAEMFDACRTEAVLSVLEPLDWSGGWTLDVDALPARVVRLLPV